MEYTISLFGSVMFILTIFHFVFDWMFQTDDLATAKLENAYARLKHSGLYSFQMLIIIISIYVLLNYNGELVYINAYHIYMLFIWLIMTHFLLDDKRFVIWWLEKIKKIKNPEGHPLFTMFVIVIDQILHILCLIPVALYLIGL